MRVGPPNAGVLIRSHRRPVIAKLMGNFHKPVRTKTRDPFSVLDGCDDETDSSRPMPHLTFVSCTPISQDTAGWHETTIGELVNT